MSAFLTQPSSEYDYGNEQDFRRQLNDLLAGIVPSSGRYTPVITSSSGGETLTYTTQNGLWVRVGGLLWFAASVALATKSGGSGDIQISLPTPAAVGPGSVVAVQVDSMAAGWTGAPTALITSGSGAIQLREHLAGVATAAWAKLGATGAVRVSGFYLPAR